MYGLTAFTDCLVQAIYHAFGGTQKGLSFKHLLIGLVVIVYGSKEEKAKCKKLKHKIER